MATNLAGVARVAFEAQTNEFNRDVDYAERNYRAATEHMSDGAIKLELANERLRRSLAKGPPAANQQARALLGVRRAEAELAAESRRTTATLDRQERQLGRLSRGAVAGSGVFHGLGRSIAFASASFLGGAGLVYGIRTVIKAAEEQQVVQAKVAQAVHNSGLEYESYRKQIDDTLQAQSKLSAFDDEDLASSFAKLVIRTKDVNQALRLNAVSADVARGRNLSLEAASQLVLKASIGQAGALRRLGIDAKKGADAQELLALVEQKYAGQAGRFAETAAGKQAYFNKVLQDSEEIIGSALLPVISQLADRLSKYLSRLNETGELQRDVNKAVKVGGEVAHDLADGFHAVDAVLEPVVGALGGFASAGKAALAIFALAKLRAIALGIRGIGTASVVAAGEVNVLAAAEERAALAGAGGAGGLGRVGTRIAAGATGLNVATAAVAGIIIYNSVSGSPAKGAKGFGEPVGETTDGRRLYRKDGVLWVQGDGPGAYGMPTTVRAGGGGPLVLYRYRVPASAGLAGAHPGEGAQRPSTGAPLSRGRNGGGGGGGSRGDGLTRLQRLQLATQRAGVSTELSDDLVAARNEEAEYRRIASNKKLHGDKLFQARSDLLSAEQRTQGIRDQIAADRQQALEKQHAKQEAAHRKELAAAERVKAARKKNVEAVRRAGLDTGSPYANTSSGFANGKPVRAGLDAKSTSGADKPLTRAEMKALIGDALVAEREINQKYAPNFALAQAQLHTSRQMVDHLGTLAGRSRFRDSAPIRSDQAAVGAF